MQYAISFSDVMNTYGIVREQDNFFVEGVTGIINAEIEKGSTFVKAVYINSKPMVLIFDDGKDISQKINNLPQRIH